MSLRFLLCEVAHSRHQRDNLSRLLFICVDSLGHLFPQGQNMLMMAKADGHSSGMVSLLASIYNGNDGEAGLHTRAHDIYSRRSVVMLARMDSGIKEITRLLSCAPTSDS